MRRTQASCLRKLPHAAQIYWQTTVDPSLTDADGRYSAALFVQCTWRVGGQSALRASEMRAGHLALERRPRMFHPAGQL